MTSPGSLRDTPPAMMSDHLIRHTTLRQLQIFEASVRFGSFTRAAEALFLTQPTVSMQIKKLADTVGLPLFEQVGSDAAADRGRNRAVQILPADLRHALQS